MFPISYLASVVSKVRQPHIEYKEKSGLALLLCLCTTSTPKKAHIAFKRTIFTRTQTPHTASTHSIHTHSFHKQYQTSHYSETLSNNNQKSTVMPHATGPSSSDTFDSDPSARPPPRIQVPPGTPASENPPGSNSPNGNQASWSYGYVNPRCYDYDCAPADEYVEIRLRTGGPDVVLKGQQAAAARFNAGPWRDDLPVKVLFFNGSRETFMVEAWSGELPSREI